MAYRGLAGIGALVRQAALFIGMFGGLSGVLSGFPRVWLGGMEGAEKSLQGGSEGSGLSVCLIGAPGCSPAEPSLLSLVGFFGLNLWEIAKGVVVARLGAIRAVSYSSGETEVRDRIMVAGLGAIRARGFYLFAQVIVSRLLFY